MTHSRAILAVFVASSVSGERLAGQDEVGLLQRQTTMLNQPSTQQELALSEAIGDLTAQLSESRLSHAPAMFNGGFEQQEPPVGAEQMFAAQLFSDPMPQQMPFAPQQMPFAPQQMPFAPQPFAAQYPAPQQMPFAPQQMPGGYAAMMTAPMMQRPIGNDVFLMEAQLRSEHLRADRLANATSYAQRLVAQAAERETFMESEARKAMAQLMQEHQLRQSAEARAAAAEGQERDAEARAAEMKSTIAAAQVEAANATARAEAVEAQMSELDGSLGPAAGVADEKRRAADFVSEAKERVAKIQADEEELVSRAHQAVKNAKADAAVEVQKVQEQAQEQIERIQSEAEMKEDRAADAENAARTAVAAAQAEARREIAEAQKEVAAQVQVTRESVERAQRLMQGWSGAQ